MRNPLDIEDDVLSETKELARRQRTSVGAIVYRLPRAALSGSTTGTTAQPSVEATVAGFRPFPAKAG